MNAAAIQQQFSELMANGQYARARDVLMRLLPKSAGNPSVLDALAVVHQHLGEHERALYFSSSAVAAGPRAAQFLITHSNVLGALARRQESVAAAEQAVALEPGNPDALNALSVSRREVGRFTAAAEAGRRAVQAAPQDDLARGNLASVLIYMGKPREAIDLAAQLPEGAASTQVRIAAAVASNYADDLEPTRIAALHRNAGEHVTPAQVEPFVSGKDRSGTKARVGIMSADLRRHSVASFVAALLGGNGGVASFLRVARTARVGSTR